MAAHRTPSAGKCVVVHLLDSAQGQPLQSWRFADCEVVTIGRGDDCDIVVVNPQVSRVHARLIQQNGAWTLVSVGRHGTVVSDRIVSELALQHQTVFQLGAGGPMLRFDAELPEQRHSETIDNIQTDLLSMLDVDDARKQQEVDQIAGNDLFRDLLEQSRQLRRPTGGDSKPN
jgi:predicted component of type VI protein secretion system